MKNTYKIMLITGIALAVIATLFAVVYAAPLFYDETNSSTTQHKYFLLPLDNQVVHYSYAASDGNNSVTYQAGHRLTTPVGMSVNKDGIISFFPNAMVGNTGTDYYTLKANSGDEAISSGRIYTYGAYSNEFTNATVTDGKINENGTDYFTDVSLETEGENNYIKGTNALRFYFMKRDVFAYNDIIMEFDVKLLTNLFNVTIPSCGQTLVQFDRNKGGMMKDANTPISGYDNVSQGWHHFKIILNWKSLKYSVFFDNSLVLNNESLKGTANSAGFRFYGADGVDNFKYHGTSLPQPYDTGFVSAPKSGMVVMGKTSAHTLNPVADGDLYNEYLYYISDIENGEYTQITTTDQTESLYLTESGGLAIAGDYSGNYLKVGVRICDSSGKTDISYSRPQIISDYDAINLTYGTTDTNVRFVLPVQSSNAELEYSIIGQNENNVSVMPNGIIEVYSVPDNALVLKMYDPENGNFFMKTLNFISNSTDGTELVAPIYPVMFKALVNASVTKQITAGSLNFIIEDNKINDVPVNNEFEFKLVCEDKKYFAFADGILVSTGYFDESLLKVTANADFLSYYFGSPLETDGGFIKCEIDSVVCEENNTSVKYSFYNESGVYPDEYEIKWYLDDKLVSEEESFRIPSGYIGKTLYCIVSAAGHSIKSNSAIINSQYSLIIKKPGSFEIDLKSTDRNALVFLLGEDKSIFFGDLSNGKVLANLLPDQDYTMFFVNKNNLAPRGVAVQISGSSYENNMLSSGTAHFCLITCKGSNGDNNAARYEKPLTYDALLEQKLFMSGEEKINACICDMYVSENAAETYAALLLLPGGCYNLISISEDGTVTETEMYNKKYELFADVKNFEYANFKNLISETLCIPDEKADVLCNTLGTLTSKEKVCMLVGNNEKYFAAAVFFAALSEQITHDDKTLSLLKEELEKIKCDTGFTELVKIADLYSLTMPDIDFSQGVEVAVDRLKSAIILAGVENAYNYKNVKQFLDYADSTAYNNASDALKNIAAKAVYKGTYDSLASLVVTVERAIATSDSSTGGSAGGSAGGSKPLKQEITMQPVVSEDDAAILQAPIFSDVPANHWAYNYIERMSKKNITVGFDGKFRPEDNITRAEYVKLMCVAFSVKQEYTYDFKDVPADAWYASYVCGAAKNGLVQGDESLFYPETDISREDAAVILWRFMIANGAESKQAQLPFKDTDFSDYAIESISELSGLGIISGMPDNSFAPKEKLTRAQAAKLICSAIDFGGDK